MDFHEYGRKLEANDDTKVTLTLDKLPSSTAQSVELKQGAAEGSGQLNLQLPDTHTVVYRIDAETVTRLLHKDVPDGTGRPDGIESYALPRWEAQLEVVEPSQPGKRPLVALVLRQTRMKEIEKQNTSSPAREHRIEAVLGRDLRFQKKQD